MAKKRHWLKHLFSFKRQVRLNNNRILEDSTILFESKKRKSIYMYSKKLLIEVSTYGKEYLVKLYKFSKKGLKLISQKSSLGNKKLKKVITFLLVAIGITISNIEAERIDEYLNSNSTTPTEIHLVMNSNSITSTRWPFIIESKNSMINNDNDCLLVRSEGPSNLGPSNFPISPTVNPGRPTVTPGTGKGLVPYVNPYRVPPKVVNSGLGAGANPAGAGGGADNPGGGDGGSDSSRKMEDTCPNPNTRQPKPERPNPSEELIQTQDKKKGEAEQCELNEEFRTDKKYGGFAYKLDKNDNPILKVNTKSGSEVLLTYDQVLQKYHHHDVYNLEPPKTFDAKEAKSLKPKDRIEYVQKNVPRDKVIEFQIANAKSLSNDNLRKVPGFIGHQKDQGNLYINTETGQVHFVNDRTNIWRTTVIKTRTGLQTLAQNGFHLFPNAGK